MTEPANFRPTSADAVLAPGDSGSGRWTGAGGMDLFLTALAICTTATFVVIYVSNAAPSATTGFDRVLAFFQPAEEKDFFWDFLIFFFMFVTGSWSTLLAVVMCRAMLSSFHQFSDEVFGEGQGRDRKMDEILAAFQLDVRAVAVALILGSAASLVYQVSGYAESMPVERYRGFIYYGVLFSAMSAGAGLLIVYRTGVAIWRLGNSDALRISPTFVSVYGFGSVLMRCYLLVLLVVTQYQFTIILFVESGDIYQRMFSPVMVLIGYPVILFVVAMFVVVQLPYVNRIRAAKADVTLKLESEMTVLREALLAEDCESNRERYGFLKARLDEMQGLSDWPTGFYRSLEAGAATLLSFLLPMIFSAF